jgi:hypothetical protein
MRSAGLARRVLKPDCEDGNERKTVNAMNENWVYYKLYTGANWDRYESLLMAACGRLYARTDIQQLFFLRYWEPAGLHLRMRFRPMPGAPVGEIGRTLETLIEGLPELPKDTYQAAIRPFGDAPLSTETRPAFLAEDVYEPEIGKYGARGIRHAEALFDGSSRLAHQIMLDDRAGIYSRKSVAPRLMYETVDALGLDADDPRFWEDYAQYWVAGQNHWLPQFRRKAAELRDAGQSILLDDAALPDTFQPQLSAWRAALADIGSEFRRVEPELATQLPSQMVHLTNNRVGVSPLEEAYFATLIAASRQ